MDQRRQPSLPWLAIRRPIGSAHTLSSLHHYHNERAQVVCRLRYSSLRFHCRWKRSCATLAMLVTFLSGCPSLSPAAVRVPGEKWRAFSTHTHPQQHRLRAKVEVPAEINQSEASQRSLQGLPQMGGWPRPAAGPSEKSETRAVFSGWIKTSCLTSIVKIVNLQLLFVSQHRNLGLVPRV